MYTPKALFLGFSTFLLPLVQKEERNYCHFAALYVWSHHQAMPIARQDHDPHHFLVAHLTRYLFWKSRREPVYDTLVWQLLETTKQEEQCEVSVCTVTV